MSDKAATRILVLGGTGEASALVRALAEHGPAFDVTLSLAGRTASPRAEPVRTRIGGFGGAQALARWLVEHGIEQVVDATHPFAARISANAARACAEAEVPLLAIRRPAWKAVDGDDWTEVADMAAAARALGPVPRRVFLTIGRQELAAFAAAPHHAYLVRTIEPVDDALPVPRLTTIGARGPFSQAAEADLMREGGIDVLVTKNAGGDATYAKVAAARDLAIPVVMVRRPDKPAVASVPDARSAFDRLAGTAKPRQPGTLRGV